MQTVHAFKQLTHKYNSGWSHLDSHEFFVTVRLTSPKLVKEGQDFDEGSTYVQYTRVPRNVNAVELGRALSDTLGGSSCRHDYDCCGCASSRVSTKLVAPRKLQVRTQISYNY